MIADDPVEMLRGCSADLEQRAQAATRTYNRGTWFRFALVFIPIPLAVMLLRLHLEAWGYYVAGAAVFVSATVLFILDSAAATKRDNAIRAAEEGHRALREAAAARGGEHSVPPAQWKSPAR